MKTRVTLLTTCFLSLVGWVQANTGVSPQSAKEPWRGVHIGIGSGKAVEQLTGVVGKLAGLGINVIVGEINYGYQYKSHPELRRGGASGAEQIEKLLAECRRHKVRLIPQFQCLGHQSWSKNTGPLLTKYPELDETPGKYPDNKDIYCRSWCPLHPQVNKIAFELMDELIEVFEADALHVGLDEVFLIGDEIITSIWSASTRSRYSCGATG